MPVALLPAQLGHSMLLKTCPCLLCCVTISCHTACLPADHARDFIKQALRKDPAQRPTVHMLLRHPWLRAYQVRAHMGHERAPTASSPLSPLSMTTCTTAGLR